MEDNIKVIPNRAGKMGSLSEADFYRFFDSLMQLNTKLYGIKECVRASREDDHPIKFFNTQLDVLDEFINEVDISCLSSDYFELRSLRAQCETDRLAITHALELFFYDNGELCNNSKSWLTVVTEHTNNWARFTAVEIQELEYQFNLVLSTLNFYLLETFLTEELDGTMLLDKSVNDWLKINSTTYYKEYNRLKLIFEEYRPRGGALITNPDESWRFIKSINNQDFVESIYEYADYLTIEDIRAVFDGTLIVNEDFITMLAGRGLND